MADLPASPPAQPLHFRPFLQEEGHQSRYGAGVQSFLLFVSLRVVNLWVSFAELYEYCIREGYADKNLIAKWKKQGYENLCCLRCIQTRDTNFGTNCICRVPKGKLEVVSYAVLKLFHPPVVCKFQPCFF